MTTAILEEEVDLERHYTEEERDAIFHAYIEAGERGDNEEANRALAHMPIHPRWAKIVAEVYGKDYLREHFNLTYANEFYGEGWLDDVKENKWAGWLRSRRESHESGNRAGGGI